MPATAHALDHRSGDALSRALPEGTVRVAQRHRTMRKAVESARARTLVHELVSTASAGSSPETSKEGAVVGVVFPGDPRSPNTWSGTPAGLAAGLEDAGVSVASIHAQPPGAVEFLARTWSPQRTCRACDARRPRRRFGSPGQLRGSALRCRSCTPARQRSRFGRPIRSKDGSDRDRLCAAAGFQIRHVRGHHDCPGA